MPVCGQINEEDTMHTFITQCYSALNKKGSSAICNLMGESESITPTEISQTEKEMLYDITYVKSWKKKKKKTVKLTEAESRIVTAEGSPPSPARRNSAGKDSGTALLGSSLQPRGARGKRSPCSLAPQQVNPGWERGRRASQAARVVASAPPASVAL